MMPKILDSGLWYFSETGNTRYFILWQD